MEKVKISRVPLMQSEGKRVEEMTDEELGITQNPEIYAKVLERRASLLAQEKMEKKDDPQTELPRTVKLSDGTEIFGILYEEDIKDFAF